MANHSMSVEEVKKHVRVYIGVFMALLVLTAVTVGVSYLHMTVRNAIIVAGIVATVKGSLVAYYFMHLNSEKKIIYWTLGLTFVLFVFLMLIAFFMT